MPFFSALYELFWISFPSAVGQLWGTPHSTISKFFEIDLDEKQDFQIVGINHMNKVVFQSNSIDFRWDGMLPSGDPAPSGNYVYFISAKTMSGKDFVKSSKLRIQR